MNLRLNQLHLSLTHEVQCCTAIGSGIKSGDDVAADPAKHPYKRSPMNGPQRECFGMRGTAALGRYLDSILYLV